MAASTQRKPHRAEPNHLYEFEKVSFDEPTSKTELSDEELNSRYLQGESRIVTEQARYPLAGILSMLEETVEDADGHRVPRYRLDPEYQRRHRWSVVRKSRLIESFLMNVPVPPIFLYERDLVFGHRGFDGLGAAGPPARSGGLLVRSNKPICRGGGLPARLGTR